MNKGNKFSWMKQKIGRKIFVEFSVGIKLVLLEAQGFKIN